ncbi:MAG: TIGR02996 domain-containing protein [Gemmataceae bacterium]|nr:TIGR02996 domain-containing protein [Gemmataceae bacterium]
MSVHFAFRSPNLEPAGKYVKRFDDETVLDWFAARWGWTSIADEEALERRVNRALGCKGHGVHRLFLDREGAPPRIVGCCRELVGGYVMDGIRLPELSRHLIETEGVNWFAEIGLLRALLPVPRKGAKSLEQSFLEQIRADPKDNATWGAYSDWLEERGEPPAGLHLLRQALVRAGYEKRGVFANDYAFWDDIEGPVRDIYEGAQHLASAYDRCRGPRPEVHLGEHLAQMCVQRDGEEGAIHDQWILFDDVWAAGQPDLANSILCFAERWDVLSVK